MGGGGAGDTPGHQCSRHQVSRLWPEVEFIFFSFCRAGAGRRTDTSEVLSLLSEFNIRPLTSSSLVLDKVSMEAGSLGMMDYEGEYLTEDQRESEGPQVRSVMLKRIL